MIITTRISTEKTKREAIIWKLDVMIKTRELFLTLTLGSLQGANEMVALPLPPIPSTRMILTPLLNMICLTSLKILFKPTTKFCILRIWE